MQRRADVNVRCLVGKVRFQHGRAVRVVLRILRPDDGHLVEVDALQKPVVCP
ncbi:hypothetical protein SDC9_184169 [bioreactor metagenome]|uniref:Uncharacterized protein n=1 Tax=bioreactor metagenome TaxID=1076179 RepID=A0A645HEU8_9ZZZZ